jgi:hypothetical protein
MQRIITWMVLIVFSAVVVGCATTPYRSTYPPPGYATYNRYPAGADYRDADYRDSSRDSADCQYWASQESGYEPSQVAQNAGVGGIIGALGGAAAGAAIGAAVGGGSGAAQGAAIGAVAGGIGGAVTGGATTYARNEQGYNQAYAACMQARGYYVR